MPAASYTLLGAIGFLGQDIPLLPLHTVKWLSPRHMQPPTPMFVAFMEDPEAWPPRPSSLHSSGQSGDTIPVLASEGLPQPLAQGLLPDTGL